MSDMVCNNCNEVLIAGRNGWIFEDEQNLSVSPVIKKQGTLRLLILEKLLVWVLVLRQRQEIQK